MATNISEQLNRIFANLRLAQSGQAPTDLPSYRWQGDHLSMIVDRPTEPSVVETAPPAAQEPPADTARRRE